MEPTRTLNPRQLWANPSPTAHIPKQCRPILLPAGGVLNIGNATIATLEQDAVYEPVCSGHPNVNVSSPGYNISYIEAKDPFSASTLPQVYAIATATIVSWMLLVILFITPRTFFVGGAGGGNGYLGRRGLITGSGSTSVIGVGSRPWLQKVAVLTVAVSLTIASVDTMTVAEQQYDAGYQDVAALTNTVAADIQIRVVRVISDTFVWLAQAQTLIRLFPRHREKVIIKWAAFALILLDVVFSILNNFVYGNPRSRPRTFVDVVPALNYLFAIALSILYMAWVFYYAISKRRFAFYHQKMHNISLVAVLSLAAIVIPVNFFVLDIASPNVSGWGDYVRWVGAAAASVVVWEWVERIEALERDENKDGILGREVFDGDEMLRDIPSTDILWQSRGRSDGGGSTNIGAGSASSGDRGTRSGKAGRKRSVLTPWLGMTSIANWFSHKYHSERHRSTERQRPLQSLRGRQKVADGSSLPINCGNDHTVTPSFTINTPISRADTSSAASTVYRAHYHPVSESTPPIREASESSEKISGEATTTVDTHAGPKNSRGERPDLRGPQVHPYFSLRVPNLFKRHRKSPPPEVSQAMAAVADSGYENAVPTETAARTKRLDRLWPMRTTRNEATTLPVTIIPWQPRGRAYLDSVEQNASASNSTAPPTAETVDNNHDAQLPLSSPRLQRTSSGSLPGIDLPVSSMTAQLGSSREQAYQTSRHLDPRVSDSPDPDPGPG